jgi:hypothetical protein
MASVSGTTGETHGGRYCGDGGEWCSDQSVRSPIFYDNNDTGYYLDPNSSGRVTGTWQFARNNNSSTSYSDAGIQLRESLYGATGGYNPPAISWHWGGVVASQISIESGGRLKVVNNPGTGYEDLIANIVTGSASIRAPIFYDSNDTGYYLDPNDGTTSIRVAGNIIAYYSDMRLKTYLGKIENAVDKVKQLEGFYYEANEIAQKLGYKPKREVGVSAQAVQEVLPEIVTEAPINANYLTINYERITPLLIEAIKEQQKMIETQNEKISKLELLVEKLLDL